MINDFRTFQHSPPSSPSWTYLSTISPQLMLKRSSWTQRPLSLRVLFFTALVLIVVTFSAHGFSSTDRQRASANCRELVASLPSRSQSLETVMSNREPLLFIFFFLPSFSFTILAKAISRVRLWCLVESPSKKFQLCSPSLVLFLAYHTFTTISLQRQLSSQLCHFTSRPLLDYAVADYYYFSSIR